MPTSGVGQRVVYGATWRRQAPRRLHAARIARLLWPIVELNGGTVSTEFTVKVEGRWYRPDVGVLLGCEPPLDGTLVHAPELVVSLGGPLTARDWLDAGATAVWLAIDGVPSVLTARAGGAARPRASAEPGSAAAQSRASAEPGSAAAPADGWLTVPGWPAIRLLAAELAAGAPTGSRRV